MGSSYQIFFDGQAADNGFYATVTSLEVEENIDLPGAFQLHLPVNLTAGGDLTAVSDDRFRPMAKIAVVAMPSAGVSASLAGALGSGGSTGAQCIFDGYVLASKLHLEKGTTHSTLAVWGQDASWLMNFTENVKEWVDVTDSDVANQLFDTYGFNPSPDNTADDSPSHTESGHSLMQRGSDIQFLRTLARRNGKFCRVVCQDQPGQYTGYFSKANLDGDPVVSLSLNDPVNWTVDALDLDWDVTRPTSVIARQALFTDSDPDGVSGDTTDAGLAPLGDRALADFAGQPMTVLLTAPVDDGGELTLRAQAALREAGWFVRCEGEADVARLNAILRVGTVVQLDGAGSLHTGKYYVWSVRHTITADSHKMKFVLMRNAVGPASAGGTGGLSALLGVS